MAYSEIEVESIAAGRANSQSVWQQVADNFDDHEDRISGIEALNYGLPAGTLISTGSTGVTSGFLACDGSEVSKADYPDLYAAIGDAFGSASNVSQFVLPDLRRRTLMGVGGSATATVSNTRGSTGGEESHVLTLAEIASHTHTGTTDSGGAHTHTANGTTGSTSHTHTYYGENSLFGGGTLGTGTLDPGNVGQTESSGGAHTHTFSATSANNSATHDHSLGTNTGGSGSAHNNFQPSVVVLFMIKT